MKILHLFSNHKPTGPAEPAVRLAAGLAERGHDVTFAHAPPKEHDAGYMDSVVADHGLDATEQFDLPKHFRPLTQWRDARRLARFYDEHKFDVVHCHMVNDHLTAALARRRSSHRPLIARTNHEAVPLGRHLRALFLIPGSTDILFELSHAALEGDVRTFNIPEERALRVDTAIELSRFDPDRELPDMRAKWGLSPDAFVVGIAARIQRRRRFDVLLDAAAILRERVPNFRLAIIGRGTHKQSAAVTPAHKRGLDDIVVFPGYLRGDEYVGGLRALDVKVFLVPGTDGSCRAAREAMALGRPLVVSRRGMLPELVSDGRDGLVVEDTPENLAWAIARLAEDPTLREEMGREARRTALERFDPVQLAEQVEQAYEDALARS
ncbi:MAG: glycosyltransferase family 4 protein [Planctomycetota bacterium]